MTTSKHRGPRPVPSARRQPLPLCAPRTAEDDPAAGERMRALLDSPAYRRADRDFDFLDRDELRPARLQLDYMKPELHLAKAGVAATIVVFGGTRLIEPVAAQRAVDRARRAYEENPGDPALARELGRAERILAKSHYYNVARELGRVVGRASHATLDSRLVVVTGGGPGIMEAANRGAFDVGAVSVGLNVTLPHEQFPNPYIAQGLCFQFRYFALRKLHFMLRARALVAFPGGYGTLDELFETLCLIQTRTVRPLPVVLVGEEYWRRVFDANFLAAEGLIDPEDAELFWFAETAQDIWRGILDWYEQAGLPLVPSGSE